MTVIRVSKAWAAYALISYVFNVEIVYVFVNETGLTRSRRNAQTRIRSIGRLKDTSRNCPV